VKQLCDTLQLLTIKLMNPWLQ